MLANLLKNLKFQAPIRVISGVRLSQNWRISRNSKYSLKFKKTIEGEEDAMKEVGNAKQRTTGLLEMPRTIQATGNQ